MPYLHRPAFAQTKLSLCRRSIAHGRVAEIALKRGKKIAGKTIDKRSLCCVVSCMDCIIFLDVSFFLKYVEIFRPLTSVKIAWSV